MVCGGRAGKCGHTIGTPGQKDSVGQREGSADHGIDVLLWEVGQIVIYYIIMWIIIWKME